MNTFLYRIGTGAYHTAIRLGAVVGVAQAKAWVNGRKTESALPDILRQPVSGTAPPPLLWMHCASLGEWEQGRPVLAAFRKRHPDYRAVLTFFSPSGYERCKDEPLVDHVAYLPPDTPGNAEEWVQQLRPSVAIFVKYEFWFYHLRALHRAAVPTFLVAANFRPDQSFFQDKGDWWRGMLRFFTGIVVQQIPAARLLVNRGNYPAEWVDTAGDPRVDRTLQLAEQPFTDPVVEAFTAQPGLTIIAGSVWPEDVRALATAWEQLPKDTRIILAPHQLHGQEVARTQVRWNAKRYTETDPGDVVGARVLILDTIGILSRVYRYGDIGYVGGAFKTGLHNTLEPMAYGLPVVFGPKHQKFPEAAAAIANGGAFSVADGRELTEVLLRLTDRETCQRAADLQRAFGRAEAGAGERTVDFIDRLLVGDKQTSRPGPQAFPGDE